MWAYIRDAIFNTVINTFGRQTRRNTAWFEEHLAILEPILQAKRMALLKYKQDPSTESLRALKTARSAAQTTARRCANNYWVNLSSRIQLASDTGNIRAMYEGIKTAFGPNIKRTAPLKSSTGAIITDKQEQMARNKGDRGDCNNYRGNSLLSIVGKTFARVALSRLQILAERTYPEAQCGFRAGRSTIGMLFSLRQLQEKCREQRMPLYLAFIDLTKAFDLISRGCLFKLLKVIGCPPKLLTVISSFHDNIKGTIQHSGTTSEEFPILSVVKQGCVLAPTLFGIFFSLMLTHAFGTAEEGVFLHTRSDGKLFNLGHLRSKTKVRKVLIRELLFADDAALTAHTEQGLQTLIDHFANACNNFGLTISLIKTNVMGQDDGRIPKDVLYGELASGTRATGRPVLRFKDVCKRDMKSCDIKPNDWEKTAGDRLSWQQAVKTGFRRGEEKTRTAWQTKRERRAAGQIQANVALMTPRC
uniref:Uncharacterized protein LOC116952123 n=1 Tax=Petromyzon marinus TaxID=7757 RepID=A0AAJ7TZP6_PETMA|nr:uncharacterized protein LOC116952123 [Petromyzon marinus]